MIFEDRFTVRAPIDEVWAFLRDPERVGRCIPGAETIEPVDDTHYRVVAGAKVGFLSVSFAMTVTVTEIDEPRRLVSIAEGMDSRLKERVRLTSALGLEPLDARTTEVGYRIDLAVFGKLAALGLGVIKGKARQMATDFAAAIRAGLETP